MSYQVIARKWRPQSFADVTGQEAITRTLTNAIEHERLHHAYVFSGARGVGKTTTARLLAKALNCHKSDKPTSTPCAFNDADACVSCREIAEGRSIDVQEIDAASNTGVDNVRESIINTVGIRPARDRYKVFITDEVHMLSTPAFNALLKTLEEPPPNVMFIMATTEAHKIPDTILSRSQQFEFRTIPVNKIVARLTKIAEAEKIDVEAQALYEIARAGEGSMRDAQSAFDQVISFSEGRITSAEVETALGLAGTELLLRTMRAIATKNPKEILQVVDDLVMRGHDLRNFTRDMLHTLRDVLLIKVSASDNNSEDDARDAGNAAAMQALAKEFNESDLVRFFHSLTNTERDLRESPHPRYQLELGLIKLIEMRRLAAIDDVLARLALLEESLRDGNRSTSSSSATSSTPNNGGGNNNNNPPPTLNGDSSPLSNASSQPTQSASNNLARDFAASETDTNFEVAIKNCEPKAATVNDSKSEIINEPNLETLIQTPLLSVAPSFNQATASTSPTVAPVASPLKLVASLAPLNNLAEANNSAAKAMLPPIDKSSLTKPNNSSNADVLPASPFDEEVVVTAHSFAPTNAVSGDDSFVERLLSELEARRRSFVAVALEQAASVRLEKDEVVVEYLPKDKHLRENLTRPDNLKALRETCRDLCGRELGLCIRIKDAAEIACAQNLNAAQLSPEESGKRDKEKELWAKAEADARVQDLLRIFRGQIVSVTAAPSPAVNESANVAESANVVPAHVSKPMSPPLLLAPVVHASRPSLVAATPQTPRSSSSSNSKQTTPGQHSMLL